MAVLSLRCCAGFLKLQNAEAGYSAVAVQRLLIVVASLVVELGFSSCDTRAQLPCGIWNLLGPGIEPVSPTLAGRCLTTEPPGKPLNNF